MLELGFPVYLKFGRSPRSFGARLDPTSVSLAAILGVVAETSQSYAKDLRLAQNFGVSRVGSG